jgi:hypothetical protein
MKQEALAPVPLCGRTGARAVKMVFASAQTTVCAYANDRARLRKS